MRNKSTFGQEMTYNDSSADPENVLCYAMDDQFQIRFALRERSALAITHHSKSDQGMPTLTRLKYFTLLLLW